VVVLSIEAGLSVFLIVGDIYNVWHLIQLVAMLMDSDLGTKTKSLYETESVVLIII